VIGAVCLLVLVGIATNGPHETVSLVGAYFPAPPLAALRAEPPAWEISDGVPVSLTIQNDGDADDRLLGGSTPVAQWVGVRRTFLVHGRRETEPLPEGIVIPADAMITLEPGKSHLALFELRTDLVQGETFPLTLRFERAGEVTVIARVRRRVDAAGIAQLSEVSLGDLTIALASAPPAPVP
jgi:copper(I)-binding protein